MEKCGINMIIIKNEENKLVIRPKMCDKLVVQNMFD